MKSELSRRRIVQAMGATALAAPAAPKAAALGMPSEGKDTPKLCMNISESNMNDAGMRRIKQLGVDYVLFADSPPIPWTEADIRSRMERLKTGGLTLANMMIPWMTPARTANGSFPNVIAGKPGRDEEIDKVRQSIRAAGRAGLPVVEYNFYAHRITEGYYDEPGRGGAGMSAFDYDRVKDLPPLPAEGVTASTKCGRMSLIF